MKKKATTAKQPKPLFTPLQTVKNKLNRLEGVMNNSDPSTRLSGSELFSFFTANIIKEKTVFTR